MSIVTDGLVGYWHYAQGYDSTNKIWKNIAPATKGKYDATLHGTTLASDGISFNGTSDYANLTGFTELNGLNAITLQVLMTAPQDNSGRYALGLYNSANYNINLGYAYISSTRVAQAGYKNNGTQYNLNGTNPISTDILLTFTMDSSGRNIYTNTSVYKSDTNVFTIQGNNTILIGVGELSTTLLNYFLGKIRAVRIYNRALTQAEINQNYSVANSDTGIPAPVGVVGSSNIDTVQKYYQPGTMSVDTQQIIAERAINVDYMKIYKASDDSVVSKEGVFDNPIQFSLNINNNESQQLRLYVSNDPNYTLSNVAVNFSGTTSDKWQIASDNSGSPGTFGSTLSLGSLGGVAGNKKYFWVKANSNNTESPGNDNSVILNVVGDASYF